MRILVVGGGFSGMSAAIVLAESGHSVELVEIDPGWRSYGAGISLHGATVRVMEHLRVLEEFRANGAMSNGVEMRGPEDQVLVSLPTPSIQPGALGNGGIMRPELARILSQRLRSTPAHIRLGVTFDKIIDRPDAVHVTFSDGTSGDYDLLIGADGLYSATRAVLFPDAPAPRYIGQAVWRCVLARPAHLPTVAMWMGPKLKVGINHVSDSQSYLFLTEDQPTRDFVAPEMLVEKLRALLLRFSSPTIRTLAEQLSEENQIVYRPLEQLLMPQPWYRGRVVLIGDAVHATTPHMAAGAMIGMEDGIVLAEELSRAPLPQALAAFQARRWERCRLVVENSGRLAEIEQGHGTPDEHKMLMGRTLGALAVPA